MAFPLPEPPLLSVLDDRDAQFAAHGPRYLQAFLERLVAAAAERKGLVVGEAEPGRYLLVMLPTADAQLRDEIDAGLDLILARLERRWPSPHISDFGLKELYPGAREPWLARHGIEGLVQEGKVGVVTILCHDWVYDLCREVASSNGLAVETAFEEYAKTGKVRVAGTNGFLVDVFANLREVTANFDPIDRLAAKLLVLAGLKDEASLKGP